MARDLTKGVIVCGVLLLVTGCWPMPNRISVSADGLLAFSISSRVTDGFYEALPQGGQIWLIDSQRGRVQTVLTEGENLSWATFSPDGNELLYVISPQVDLEKLWTGTLSHPWRLMVFERRREIHTLLIGKDRGFVWGPTFSPDGRQIAYYQGDGQGHLGLYLFDRESGQEQLLVSLQDPAGVLSYAPYGPGPLWTADGQGVFVFALDKILEDRRKARAFAGKLAILERGCRCPQRLVAQGIFPIFPVPLSVVASRDGEMLYVNGYGDEPVIDPASHVHLYEVAVRTGERRALYDGGGIVVAPALSPNNQRLLFTLINPRYPVTTGDLYLLDLLDLPLAPRALTQDGRSGFGFWVSDEEIGFLRLREGQLLRGELWLKNLGTDEERNLSALLEVQSSVPKLLSEVRAYREEIAAVQRDLDRVDAQLQRLHDALTEFSHKLEIVQTQSLEMSTHTSQQLSELGQKISVLMADMSVVKTQLSVIEAEVKAVSARPVLSLWQLAIALLIAVVVIVWLIRRALHLLAQTIAFPPQ